MPIKAKLETLDGLDEALKPFYTEREGEFHLDVEDIRDHHEVLGLRNAYDRTKEDLNTAKRERDTARTELANANKGRPDAEALQTERQGYLDQIATLTSERDEARGKLTGATRDQALTNALTAAGVTKPAFLRAAINDLKDRVQQDGDRFVIEGGMGPKDLAQAVKDWAANEGKDFVSPPTGGGVPPQNQGGGPKELKDMTGEERVQAIKDGKLKPR